MDVILLRHGQTPGNLRGAYIGVTDEGVCPESLAVLPADATAETVFVTPLLRTRQSAAAWFPNARQITVEALREMDFGAFEGRNYEDMQDDPAYRAWVEANCAPPCPGGESKGAFTDRVCAAFEALVTTALAQGAQRLLLVVHGGVIMAVASRYALPRRDYFAWATANGVIRRFSLDETRWHAEKTMQYTPEG